jgi:hypothetical protein
MSARRFPEAVTAAFAGVTLVALAWYTLLSSALPLCVPGGSTVFVDGYKGLAVAGSCLVGACIALAIMLRLMQSTRENKRSGRPRLKACDAQNLGHNCPHVVGFPIRSYGTVLFLVIAPPTLYLGSLMLLQTKAG